jgi:hypothetical protein
MKEICHGLLLGIIPVAEIGFNYNTQYFSRMIKHTVSVR